MNPDDEIALSSVAATRATIASRLLELGPADEEKRAELKAELAKCRDEEARILGFA